MATKVPKKAGGFHAATYALKMARKSGNFKEFYKILKSKNTCKTCALGMQGMKNEIGESFQVCKKAMQAVAHDLLKGINPEVFSNSSADELGSMRGIELEAMGRIVEPHYLAERQSHYKPVSWEEAYKITIDALREVDPDRLFFYVSGRSSNEAAFTTQILARQIGTNNVSNCSFYCHQATGVGLKQSLGSGTATITLEDIEKADLVVLIGANPSSNHPRFIAHLQNLRKRGGNVIVINPMKEVGLQYFRVPSKPLSLLFGINSKVSDLYLQPHCGGDFALLKAVTAHLWQEKLVRSDFLRMYCNNVDEYLQDLEQTDIGSLLEMTGITKNEMLELADYLLAGKNVIFAWAMGLTHQEWGVETIRSVSNLALLIGQIGAEGRGLLPLRGHSNVQGIGSMGVAPKLSPEVVDSLAEIMNVSVPEKQGKDTYDSMMAAYNNEIDLALMLGGNLYGANPDLSWAEKSLSRIPLTIYVSTTLNLGHFHGRGKSSLILPVRARNEDKQSTTQESMFNYVRLSDGGFDAPSDKLPTEVELFSKIGKALYADSTIPWTKFEDYHKIRDFISKTIPGMTELAGIDEGRKQFTIDGRIYHTPEFNTDNGKANLFVGSPPDPRPPVGSFNMMTFRSEGQFNTIIYEEEDFYRGVKKRDVIFMNMLDINDKGLKIGNRVSVESSCGKMDVEVVEGAIKKGNVAMYYPEGNAIVPRNLDPQSKTPAYKRVEVIIEKN